MAPRRPPLNPLLLLLLLVAAVHARGLAGGFVYDDPRFLTHNPALSPVRPWAYLVDPATASAATGDGISADVYRPLRTLAFALERAAFGERAVGYHAVSLLLHLLVVGLTWRTLRRLLPTAPAATWLAAALVGVHPVTVESVAWISSQGDLLAWALLLLALEVLARPGLVRSVGGAALVGAACLAKESALVAPLLLLLRDRALPAGSAPPPRTSWSRAALLGAVGAGYLLLRQSVLPGLAQVPHPEGSALGSLKGFLLAVSWYAGGLLWPRGFRLETDLLVPLSFGDPAAVLGLGLVLTLLLVGIFAGPRRAGGVIAFAALGGLVALGPVSQVLVPLKSLAAERFLYPVLPCLAAGVALALAWLARRAGPLAAWAPAALLVPLGAVTWARTAAWTDEESLWTAVRRDRPANGRAYHGLGEALFAKGRFGEASAAYHTYLQAWRYDGKARFQLVEHIEGWVRTLRSDDPEIERSSTLGRRRRELRALQAGLLLAAIDIWRTVGYEAGRGSPAFEAQALERLWRVASELGDLGLMRRALGDRLRLEGLDPASPADVAARGSFTLRRMRWVTSWQAVAAPERDLTPEQRRERLQQRADALRDAGLDPQQADETLARALEAPLLALREEAEALARARRGGAGEEASLGVADGLASLHADLFARTGRGEEAQALREARFRQRRALPTAGR